MVEPAIFDRQVILVPQVFVGRIASARCMPILCPPFPVPHTELAEVDTQRDLAEIAFFGATIRDGLPFLDICRGLQLLNTLCGGTMQKHLPEIVRHDGHLPGAGVCGPQRLHRKCGSRLATIVSTDIAVGLRRQHQAIDQLDAGLSAQRRRMTGHRGRGDPGSPVRSPCSGTRRRARTSACSRPRLRRPCQGSPGHHGRPEESEGYT